MSKTLLVILACLIVLVGGLGTAYIFISRQRQTSELTSNFPVITPGATPAEENVTYQDSSGFSFDYPPGLSITDITPNESSYYSLLNIAKAGGKITITVKDAKTSEAVPSGASLVGATSLAGMSAKQYEKGSDLITVVYDNGILYLIEGPKDNAYWESAQNTIVSTFALSDSGSSGSSGSSSEGSSEGVTMEEEVVQ